jgi:outer membrane protein OmpA-like peptidoglycan-associated protein
MSSYLDWPRYSRATWIVAALLIVLLLLLWFVGHGPDAGACCSGTVAVTPPPAAAPATPAPPPAVPAKPAGKLNLVSQGNKITLTGVVPDQATHDSLAAAATGAYGAGNVIDHLTIDANAPKWTCLSKPEGLLGWLKYGFRSAVVCSEEGVIVSGVVPDQAAHDARLAAAKEFYGSDVNLIDHIVISAPLATTVSKAEDVKCGGSIAATINFASGSADIDEDGKKLLDAIAPCLTGPYEIDGHTDSSGDDEINLPLSKHRADAVRDYLVGKGVAAANLTTEGFGAERPIADNATDEGKAKNRRIEFIKK